MSICCEAPLKAEFTKCFRIQAKAENSERRYLRINTKVELNRRKQQKVNESIRVKEIKVIEQETD